MADGRKEEEERREKERVQDSGGMEMGLERPTWEDAGGESS